MTTQRRISSTLLPYPTYTDPIWNKPQLIYGQECKTDNVDYSDRMHQYDPDKSNQADESCKAIKLKPRTSKHIKAWLGFYHNRPVVLRYVYGVVNPSNGSAYYIYGYDWTTA